jgi:serine acetyltransferase
VAIGAGSWLGTGAVILPGTRIGRQTVVAAGAVVRGEFPGHCVLAGVPARVVRTFAPGEAPRSGSPLLTETPAAASAEPLLPESSATT